MKKQTTLFLISILSIILACSGTESDRMPKYSDFDNAWQKDKLFGKVQSLNDYKANVTAYSSNTTEAPILKRKKFYTEFGKIKMDSVFDSEGNLEQYTEYKYDSLDNNVNWTRVNVWTSTTTIQHSTFDKTGSLISARMTSEDTVHHYLNLKYSSNGDIVESHAVENNDTTLNHFQYKYDSKGNIIYKKQFDTDGNKFETKFEYDENGNKIKIIIKTDYAGTRLTSNIYDKYNRIKEIIQFDQNDNKESKISFDNYYNEVSRTSYQDGKLLKEMKFEYEFDEIGNWIQKKAFMKEHVNSTDEFLPIYVESREINYYD